MYEHIEEKNIGHERDRNYRLRKLKPKVLVSDDFSEKELKKDVLSVGSLLHKKDCNFISYVNITKNPR